MAPEPYFIAMAAVLGAAVGSFLNVCIVRLPADQSLVRPRSRCPRCGAAIAWFDNIPILSWVALRGRCRSCSERISIQYPLIEGVVALLWAGAAWHYGIRMAGLEAAIFGTLLTGIAITDARHYLIPDEYTLGGGVMGLVFAGVTGVDGLLQALLGAAVGFLLLLFIAWAGRKAFGKEAMGGGDIKMMAMVGTFVGWQGVLLTVFGGALLGTVIFVPLTIGRRRLVPFGVFLAAASAIAYLWGSEIITWYIGFAQGG